MPYVKGVNKEYLDNGGYPCCAGELNYAFTRIITKYLENDVTYQKLNDVIGALEGAKLELYRRVVVPYENRKILENGDVYK